MPITKLSEVLQVLELQTDQDEINLTIAIKAKDHAKEMMYQYRCQVRDQIIEMLKTVDKI